MADNQELAAGEDRDGIQIERADQVTDELFAAWGRLLPQLSKSAPAITRDELTEICESDATVLFMARLNGEYVGSLTLVVFRIPDGLRAWIESVVVDESARGRGIGERLSREAVEYARGLKVRSIDLTSGPSREAANRLYKRIGFEPRQTNIYRYKGEETRV